MKRIYALILTITMLTASLLALTSCGGDNDTPDGMQLVFGGKNSGYYFYAPEEWSISNIGEIKSAYVSKLDTTSVSFCKVTDSITENGGEEYFFGTYFEDSMKEAPETLTINITLNGEATAFGKKGEEADKAVKYIYNYKYSERSFGFMQILLKEGDEYYVFTYRALLEAKDGDVTYYDYYLEKLQKVIDEFRFVEKEETTQNTEYKKDADGYILISNSKHTGFDMYVPESFVPDYSNGIVSATHSDGSNINMTEAFMTGNNVTVQDYFETRKQELSAFVSEITEVETFAYTEVGNSNYAYSYEYTYVYNGEKYHVFQVYIVEGFVLSQNGYVLTYTAKDVNYSSHLEEIKTVMEKINFR